MSVDAKVDPAVSRLATGPLRLLWFGLGWIFVALGGVGAVLPGVPTTGFLILAASCFSRSSPRFEKWVLDLPKVGPMVRDYRLGLGMPRRAKVLALSMIATVSTLSIVFGVSSAPPRIAIGVLAAIGLWFVAYRVPTREDVLAGQV